MVSTEPTENRQILVDNGKNAEPTENGPSCFFDQNHAIFCFAFTLAF